MSNYNKNPNDLRQQIKGAIKKQTDYLAQTGVNVLAKVVSFDQATNKVSIELLGDNSGLILTDVPVATINCQVATIQVMLKPDDMGIYTLSKQNFEDYATQDVGIMTDGLFVPTSFAAFQENAPIKVMISEEDVVFTIGNISWAVKDFVSYFNDKVIGLPSAAATQGINKNLTDIQTSVASAGAVVPYVPSYISQYTYPSGS